MIIRNDLFLMILRRVARHAEFSMADLQGMLMRHVDRPAAALLEVRRTLAGGGGDDSLGRSRAEEPVTAAC